MAAPKRRKILQSLYLEPAETYALDRLQKRLRIPKAVLLREAVDDLLAKYKVRAPAGSRGNKP